MPGVPGNAEVAALLKGTEFEEKLQRLCEEKGFRILTWWWFDGGMASRTHPIIGPAASGRPPQRRRQGLQQHAGGGGTEHRAVPLTEVRAAMLAGKLDVAQNSFEFFVSMRFHEFAKSVTVGGHGALTVFMPVLISKAVWEELQRRRERQALEDAAAASDIYFEASQRESQEAAIDVFSKAGVQVQALSFKDYADWLIRGGLAEVQVDQPEDSDLFNSLLRSFIQSKR